MVSQKGVRIVRNDLGLSAAHAAWILAQHADQDPEFQRSCLPLLKAAVEAGQATPSEWAYLLGSR
ncbi:hypothetical protein GCM10023075_79700 [Streptosporangium album]